ncbi:PAS domain-containing sensor histidine kinase [Metabacillus mangrovi]|nr:ATP-binding protein [Metabacillus mangrovi]
MSFHIESYELIENEDAYLRLNSSWKIQSINDEGAKLFRDTRKNCIGRSVMDYISHEDAALFKTLLTKAMQNEKSSRLKLRYSIFEKTKITEIGIYPAGDGLSIVFKDITASIRFEQAIQEKYEKVMLLSETTNDMIGSRKPEELLNTLYNKLSEYLDLDVFINFMYVPSSNHLVLSNYSGITKEEANGISLLQIGQAICGAAAERKEAMLVEHVDASLDKRTETIKKFGLKAYVSHPLVYHGKLLGTLSFGSKTRPEFKAFELEVIQTACEQVASLLERICMIAELKKNNRELTEAKEAAEKASKAKSHFLSMMSHELRTPLHTIMGFSDILLDEKKDPVTGWQREKIQKIASAGDHLLHVINDILDLVRLEKGKPFIKKEATPVNKIVKNSVKWILPFAETKGITIEQKLARHEILAAANKVRLKQIMLNLLSNAVKYNRQNGAIFVRVEKKEEMAFISVKDTGYGISVEDQRKIFDPFYRSTSFYWEVEGSGVGLSLTKQLVEEMGGTLGVESELDKGSTFWVKLPL